MSTPQAAADRARPPRRYVKPCACGSTDRRRPIVDVEGQAWRLVICAACDVELYRFPSRVGAPE